MKKQRNCSGEFVRVTSDTHYIEHPAGINITAARAAPNGGTVYTQIFIPLEKLEKTLARYRTKRIGKWKD